MFGGLELTSNSQIVPNLGSKHLEQDNISSTEVFCVDAALQLIKTLDSMDVIGAIVGDALSFNDPLTQSPA